jgi:FAD/FMN-containing dehydrogenase
MPIAQALHAIVGEIGLLSGEDVSARSCDPFRNVPPRGGLIVRPASTAELSAVMALCSARGQAVVAHGGRTGVSGGAYAGESEIVVSLERMRAVLEISPEGPLAVVEAGASVEALQQAAAAQGLFYPVDLGSKGSATIGGTIATNAGGNRVLRWGMTRQNLLGVEAVLADGTVVSSMNRLLKNNMGYALKDILCGSEGTLGIITRAVLRLVPQPSSQDVAFVSVTDHAALVALLARARRLPTLSAFEVMWPDYYDLVAASDTGRRPVPPGTGPCVLVESMGYHPESDRRQFEEFLFDAGENGLIADAVLAESGKQVAELWRVREAAEVIVRAMSPFVSFDISLGVADIEPFLPRVRDALLQRFGILRTATFGHLGDNNIHIAAYVGPDTAALESEVEAVVFGVLRGYDGAITAEHGIGQHKRVFLPAHKHTGEMEMMRRLRDALDPDRLLNRDVLF